VEEVPRRIYWLALVAAVAAGTYVAYRLGIRPVERTRRFRTAAADESRLRWAEEASVWEAPAFGPATAAASETTHTEAEEAPTGGVATVLATVDGPSATAQYEGNGSPRAVPLAAPGAAATAGIGSAPVQIPKRRGLSGTTLALIATGVGVAAIALGAWAVALSLDDEGGGTPTSAIELQGVQQVVSLLSKPSTERIPLQGSSGKIVLVVGARGYGVLVLDGLSPAPAGKTYQAWVIRPNADTPQSAAVFSARDVVVPLTTAVPPGAAVAITLEKAGGVQAPTQTPKLVAKRAT
jgi:Anti-sigma-K factor rskA, C-terminal